jgi:tRNA/rRNA methyltransferase
MKNMGLKRLILVSPEQDQLSEEARMMATSARDILEKAEVFPNLEEALKGFRWIAGTSARKGRNRGPFLHPRQICPEILKHAQTVPVAIIFGPEDRGLTNEDLAPCHALVSMPTHEGLRSLNLAQAVMVFCYELFVAGLALSEKGAGISGPDIKPAEFKKTEGMYAHLEELLLKIGFLEVNNPKRIMHTLRRIFGRAGLSDRDVAILRGIFRQLEWYATKRDPKGS